MAWVDLWSYVQTAGPVRPKLGTPWVKNVHWSPPVDQRSYYATGHGPFFVDLPIKKPWFFIIIYYVSLPEASPTTYQTFQRGFYLTQVREPPSSGFKTSLKWPRDRAVAELARCAKGPLGRLGQLKNGGFQLVMGVPPDGWFIRENPSHK